MKGAQRAEGAPGGEQNNAEVRVKRDWGLDWSPSLLHQEG